MVTKQAERENGRGVAEMPRRRAPAEVDWSLLSSQGRILFYIAFCPDCSVEEMSQALDLTERAVWGVIRELRRKGMLTLRRDGRKHRYRVNLDAPLLHPTIDGLTLRPVLGKIAERGMRQTNENCVRVD
jgi:DNA-binding transcriptional ArsR family regulator